MKLTEEKLCSVQEVLHEVPRTNGVALNCADELINYVSELALNDEQKSYIIDNLLQIYHSASMLKARLAIVQVETRNLGTKIPIDVYKKFDKAKRILKGCSRKNNVKVSLVHSGNIQFCVSAYDIFDFIPFAIIDNAIKYSLKNSEVTISFVQNLDKLMVTINSYGPHIEKDEIEEIFQRGYRARATKITGISGSGLGLFLVKRLCDIHGITISCDSAKETSRINGIDYSQFVMNFCFHR